MNAGNGWFRFAVFFLGAALLCGCATPRTAERPGPKDPVSVRLPIITPLKVEQPASPQYIEPTIAPAEVEEGKARSLKLFQIDYERGMAGPAVAETPPGPVEEATKP
ncbi:MAG: hypothetical protein AB1346_14345 [Thermodesulfobacteriota bacterium]